MIGSDILRWLLAYGYPLMFAGMALEGPMVTAASAFAASLGYFNLGVVFLLSIAGDVLPDMAYYALGYYGHQSVVRRLCRFFKIPEEKLDRARAFLGRHQIKGLMLFKYAPFLAITGLVLTGTNKMPFKKFVLMDTLIGIPNTLLFVSIGYLAGRAFESAVKTAVRAEQAAALLVVMALVLYWAYRWTTRRLARRLEKEAGLDA